MLNTYSLNKIMPCFKRIHWEDYILKKLTYFLFSLWLTIPKLFPPVKIKPFGPIPQPNYIYPFIGIFLTFPFSQLIVFMFSYFEGQHKIIGSSKL
jgi:hypothetical protein